MANFACGCAVTPASSRGAKDFDLGLAEACVSGGTVSFADVVAGYKSWRSQWREGSEPTITVQGQWNTIAQRFNEPKVYAGAGYSTVPEADLTKISSCIQGGVSTPTNPGGGNMVDPNIAQRLYELSQQQKLEGHVDPWGGLPTSQPTNPMSVRTAQPKEQYIPNDPTNPVGNPGGKPDDWTQYIPDIPDEVPREWSFMPRNSTFSDLKEAGAPDNRYYGTTAEPTKNLMANWVYTESGNSPWKINMCRYSLGSCRDGLARDNQVIGSVALVYAPDGSQLGSPNQPQLVPGGGGGGGGPGEGTPGQGGGGPIVKRQPMTPAMPCAGGVQPMVTQRRTCGRGMVLGIDGLCYPKNLPAALKMNRSKKAVISWRDNHMVTKALQVARRARKYNKKIDKLSSLGKSTRRRAPARTTRKR